jgi:putative copper export protein/methionine-rich copper-binding protein CopC
MPTPSPATVPARLRVVAVATLLLAVSLLLLVGPRPAAAAARPVATQPAANAVAAAPPRQVVVHVPGAVDTSVSGLTVFRADHTPVATTASPPAAGHPGALVADLPALRGGVYTVVWHAAGAGGARRGSFAFAVDPAGASPALVAQTRPHDTLTPASQGIPKWLAFVTIMTFIGTLALRALVTAPASGGLDDERRGPLLAATDRGLLLVAGAAILCFIPATLAQLVTEATDPDAGLSFWRSIRPGAIGDFLRHTPDGHLWLARLAVTLVAVLAVLPAALAALVPGWRHRPRRVGRLMGAALLAAVVELALRVAPTSTPDDWAREIFTDALDWGHLVGASVWVGGLVGLAVLGVLLRLPARRRAGFWAAALRRFSVVATVCVGVMVLTGLWTAWIHVGAPRLLVHTLYGETLLVKLGLIGVLVGLGALNQLWLLPRVNALREASGESLLGTLTRRFRRVVVAEALVGVLILLVVPFLSSSARNQAFAARAADLTQTRRVDGQAVALRPSGAQPGMTDYDVWVPHAAGGRVTVGFSSRQLGVPSTDVLATAVGAGQYRVTGLQTPMVGDWQVVVAGGRRPVRFDLTVSATAVDPGKPATPPIRASTWEWGAGEVLAVLVALGGAALTTRRLTRRRQRRLERAAAARTSIDRASDAV